MDEPILTTGAAMMRNCVLHLLAVVFTFFAGSVYAQDGKAVSLGVLSSAQIVEQMERHDQSQLARLLHYRALRHYAAVYRGYSRTIMAKMDVEVNYDVSSGKSFRIISQSGSGMLCQKVLKRAVDSEKDASLNKSATALTPANYRFHLVGSENIAGRMAYILDVEPVAPKEFLYRGRIWVDAADFAVAKMEVQPAKNPSFWISRTLIHHTNAETAGFWLPEHNRSETKVLIGGTAVLTIDYGKYEVAAKELPPRIGLERP
jgi:hypothetical protein